MRSDGSASDLWERALDTLHAARILIEESPDNSASRAYYAAMHAVEALFLLEGRNLNSHAAVWEAFHNSLIRTGRWPAELSKRFRLLRRDRDVGDYGGGIRLSVNDARDAYSAALAIIEAVHQEAPEVFPKPTGE